MNSGNGAHRGLARRPGRLRFGAMLGRRENGPKSGGGMGRDRGDPIHVTGLFPLGGTP